MKIMPNSSPTGIESAGNLESSALETKQRELRKACEKFEGVFLAYLFRVMRETIPKSGLLDSGLWQGMFDVVFDQALGEKVAQRAKLGIAEMLEKQLSPAVKRVVEDEGSTKQVRDFSREIQRVKSLRELDDIVNAAARAQSVDADLVRAVIEVESGWDPRAVSPKGAVGLMQLMPDTAREVGVQDPLDPYQNVFGGTAYLRRLLDTFDGDLRLALAAYNAGPGAVRRHGGVPPFQETQRYVEKVLNRYFALKKLAGNSSRISGVHS